MSFRFTIGRKIGLGFGILIFLTLVAFLLTYLTLKESRKINDEITKVITPSVDALEELNLMTVRSKMLITNWAYITSSDDNADKKKLRELINKQYPELKARIMQLSVNWTKDEQESINSVFGLIEKLFVDHAEIMQQLKSFESYEDPIVLFLRNSIEEGDIDQKTKLILDNLSSLIAQHHERANMVSGKMIKSFNRLQWVVIVLGLALVLGGMLIAVLTVRSIVRPVQRLKRILKLMGKGIVPEERITYRNDEIGEMSIALSDLVDSVKRTTIFANQVGSGNFESQYQPLSERDALGQALIKMRDDLRENSLFLEQKVEERTAEVVRQKEEIEAQSVKLEYLYKQVTDSIKYAKRIQEAILPPDSIVKKLLPKSFILYKPKDIVSGDFYWVDERNGKSLFAAVDCTGHGVPGAFMSIVGYNLLKLIVSKLKDPSPADILNYLNEGVSDTLHQGLDESTSKDGMDIALCSINYKKNELEYSGAYNSLYIVRDNEIQEVKADKFPIGMFVGNNKKEYTNHKIKVREGDSVYIFSDGYADQFGGSRGKKFMAKQFRQILIDIQNLSMDQQKHHLDRTIEQWRGNHEQVDDILVIGVRI